MEELINRFTKIPVATKLAVLGGVFVVLTAGNYFLWPGISDIQQQTENLRRQLKSKEDEYTKKQEVANNLDQYKRELEVVEQQLKEALTEMPEEIKIDDLLTQLAELAKKAGLSLRTLNPLTESKGGPFYYKIPIKMEVTGGYHEIAVFLDSVSKLKRIVNVNNIQFQQPKLKADKVVLTASYLATTFRFAGEKQGKKKEGHR